MNFTKFLIESDLNDIKNTLSKVPAKHAALLKGYKFIFEKGNCLRGDSEHIGCIDEKKKTVTIAAPWNYGREFTLLHELAHAVWKYFVNEDQQKEWSKIVKKTNLAKKDTQNIEELMCHAYANFYCKNNINKYYYTSWEKFIKNL
jgi:hypothetical protein